MGMAEGVSGGETSCHLLRGSKIARAIRPRMCPIKAGGAWDEGVEGNRGLEKGGGPGGACGRVNWWWQLRISWKVIMTSVDLSHRG